MNISGDYVVVDGYRFDRFNRVSFDIFEVFDNNLKLLNDLSMGFQGREVEIITMSNCCIHSKAMVCLVGLPIDNDEGKAVFTLSYYRNSNTGEMEPKGGFLVHALD